MTKMLGSIAAAAGMMIVTAVAAVLMSGGGVVPLSFSNYYQPAMAQQQMTETDATTNTTTTNITTQSQTSESEDVNTLFSRGYEAYEQGMYQQAIEYFDRVLAIEPNFLEALNYKGVALLDLRRHQEAIEYYDRALAIDPNYLEALNNKGNALVGQERILEAIEYYDRALAIDANYVKALINKGVTIDNTGGDTQEAIEYYDRALAIEPNDIDALYNKAIALRSQERDQEEAMEYFDRVLAIEPNDIDALYNKGNLLHDLGRYSEAIEYYDKVLAIDPNHVDALASIELALNNLEGVTNITPRTTTSTNATTSGGGGNATDDDIVFTILSHRPLRELEQDDSITAIVGEVRNDSPNTIGGVNVRGMFYDSNGQLIDVAEFDPAISVLRPGERAPFYISTYLDASIVGSNANYTLSPDIESSYTIDIPAALKVAIGDHGVVENTEHVAGIVYEIVGTVTNMGNRPTTYVSVIATFYDAAGKIIDFKGVGTFPAEIPPGVTAEFIFEEPLGSSGNWTAETNSVASFNVNVESAEYLSVMESPFASTEEEGATAAEGAADFLTYDNATYGITIQYPSNWIVETTDYPDDPLTQIVTFFSPLESRIDTFQERLWIAQEQQSFSEDFDLAQYAEQIVSNYNSTLIDFSLDEIDTETARLGNNEGPAYRMVYTYAVEFVDSPGVTVDLKSMEIGTVIGDKLYIVEYDADIARYDQYLPIIEEMIRSMQLISIDTGVLDAPTVEDDISNDSFELDEGNRTIGAVGGEGGGGNSTDDFLSARGGGAGSQAGGGGGGIEPQQ
jgi:tetratricopeptide (TPR) repeat protein